jgi:hypothetical protein
MDNEGKIATPSLNDTAQLALGYALADREDVIVLNETTLRLKGDPAKYTGDAGSDLLIDGEIHSNTVISADQGFYTQSATNSAQVNIKTADNTAYHTLTSNATGLYLNTNLEVGTLKYSALDPAIEPTATPNISDVLAVGNDAGDQNIIGVGDLSVATLKANKSSGVVISNEDNSFTVDNYGIARANVFQATNSGGNSIGRFNNIAMYSDDGSTQTAILNADGNQNVHALYLYGVNPSDFAITNDKNISTTGIITSAESKPTKIRDTTNSVGTVGQVLTSNASNEIAWATLPAPTAQSLSDVLLTGNSAGATSIDMNTQNITNVSSITSTATGDITTSTLNTKVLNNTRSFGIDCNTELRMKGNTLVLADGVEGMSVFQSNSSGTSALSLYGGGIQLNKNSYFTLANNSGDNILNCNPANNSLISSTNATLSGFASINGIVPQYIPAQEYWVSKSGLDTNIGSILNPFLTIGKALEVVETFTDGLPRVINVLQGSYTQDLTITKSRVSILGQNPSGNRADTGCSINGTLLIACTGDNTDMNNNNIYISNLQINGSITNTSSTKNRLSLANCYIYGNSQLIYMNNSNDYRFFMNNCTLSNESTIATNEMLLFSGSGMVSITNCQLTQKGLGNVVHFNGSSRVDTFAQNILTSDSTSVDAQAILKITSSNTKAIGNCAFIYSSSSPKSTVTPKFSCGILMNTPSSSYTGLSLWNNVFSLAGTTGTNTDFAVNAVNANSSVIYFGNNASVLNTNAHNIVGNLNSTKIPFTSVQ